MSILWRLVFATLVICGSACSDDPEPRPRYGAPEAIAGNSQVSTLNTEQKRELCASFDAYTSTYVDLSSVAYLACLPVAIWTTLDEAACRASLDGCVKGFPKPIAVSVTARDENLCFQSLAQCNATVAQLEGCANVNVDAALQVISSWTCARVTDPEVKAMAAPMADLVNVCADVNGACNQFATVGPD
jgi:hypothetical protein